MDRTLVPSASEVLSACGLAFLVLTSGCRYYQVPPPAPLTLEQIISMAQEGRTPDEIIAEIDKSRTLYELSAEDVIRLSDGGVDSRVIDYMLETHRRFLKRRYDPYWYPYYPYPPGWYYCW